MSPGHFSQCRAEAADGPPAHRTIPTGQRGPCRNAPPCWFRSDEWQRGDGCGPGPPGRTPGRRALLHRQECRTPRIRHLCRRRRCGSRCLAERPPCAPTRVEAGIATGHGDEPRKAWFELMLPFFDEPEPPVPCNRPRRVLHVENRHDLLVHGQRLSSRSQRRAVRTVPFAQASAEGDGQPEPHNESHDRRRAPTRRQRLLGDFTQDRCLARLGPGVRRDALDRGCPPGCWVWLSSGLRPAGHRDEAWLKRGLPSS